MTGDWTEATLSYVLDGDEILLIEKKQGHGAGKYNGPGGKVEDGETIREAAIREHHEETGTVPVEPEKVAELEFFFGGDPFQRVHVFLSDDHQGEQQETEEARPEWFDVDDIPYDKMWADDSYWLPDVLDGKRLRAEFYFDEEGEEIRDYSIETGPDHSF